MLLGSRSCAEKRALKSGMGCRHGRAVSGQWGVVCGVGGCARSGEAMRDAPDRRAWREGHRVHGGEAAHHTAALCCHDRPMLAQERPGAWRAGAAATTDGN